MLKAYPIKTCKECPKLNEEEPYYECTLSDKRCYEKDTDEWMEILEEYCPLEFIDTITDEAFQKGREYERMVKEMDTRVRLSAEPTRWHTGIEWMEKLEKHQKG